MNKSIDFYDDPSQEDQKWKRHIIQCPRGDDIVRGGDDAERRTAHYLLDNLSIRAVGDFRILKNYNMPVRSSGAIATQEIDLVIINRFGVFLIEVKDWLGKVVAYDDTWTKDGHDMKGNPLISIESKSRTFKSLWFTNSTNLDRLNVKGIVVLARGKESFENRSNYDERSIVGIGQALLNIVNPPAFLMRPDHRKLSDEEISQITANIFKKHTDSGEVLIEDYRLESKLLPGDLYKAYEAINTQYPIQHVRIKIYKLEELSNVSEQSKKRIRRDADAIGLLGHHPNILFTYNFFPDIERPNLFYEVTEMIDGVRLDKLLADQKEPLPFETQLSYLGQLCNALSLAHSKKVFHRNICPETIYVTRDGKVKLADFDFAQISGNFTINIDRTKPLVDNEFTPPELLNNSSDASPASDLYSLGCIWLYLASWPSKGLIYNRIQNLPISLSARDLMQSLLSAKPAERPKTADILHKKLQQLQTL